MLQQCKEVNEQSKAINPIIVQLGRGRRALTLRAAACMLKIEGVFR
jgi:hypothetical protein